MHVAQVWRTEVRLEILLRTLGLSNAADTLIGSAIVRGISGGEQKRVTSAEMLVGPKASSQDQRLLPHTMSRSAECMQCYRLRPVR